MLDASCEVWLHNEQLLPLFKSWCEANLCIESVLFYRDVQKHKEVGERIEAAINEMLRKRRGRDVLSERAGEEDNADEEQQQQEREGHQEDEEEEEREETITREESLVFGMAVGDINPVPPVPAPIGAVPSVPEDIKQLWHGEFYELTAMIFEMYIKIPTAPLEVNIPAWTRSGIEKALKFQGANKQQLKSAPKTHDHHSWHHHNRRAPPAASSATIDHGTNDDGSRPVSSTATNAAAELSRGVIPPFNDFWDSSNPGRIKSQTQTLIHVYDRALTDISRLIKHDVFPRFRMSAQYTEGLNIVNGLQQQQSAEEQLGILGRNSLPVSPIPGISLGTSPRFFNPAVNNP
jgi:hypothetical protein